MYTPSSKADFPSDADSSIPPFEEISLLELTAIFAVQIRFVYAFPAKDTAPCISRSPSVVEETETDLPIPLTVPEKVFHFALEAVVLKFINKAEASYVT